MIGAFNEVGLVPVAYVQVEGNGSATESNSGVDVVRNQAGAYTLTLASGKELPDKEAYPIVTLWETGYSINIVPIGPLDGRYYLVNIVNLNTHQLSDAKFSFTLFRTVTPVSNNVPA